MTTNKLALAQLPATIVAMQYIIIEKVSENMAEATVGQWFAREGDRVAAGDLVVELITEKATFEIEAAHEAVVLKTYAAEKSILPVGYTVCILGPAGTAVSPDIEAANRELLAAASASLELPAAAASDRGRSRVKATPAARRKARASGIDLTDVVQGLAIEGVVTEKDVDRFIESGS